MAIFSTIFWLLGLILAVTIAPQTRAWTWGPTLLCLGAATLFALPCLLKRNFHSGTWFILFGGLGTAAWITARSLTSPVAELGIQDLLLLLMAISTFVVFWAVGSHRIGGEWIAGGIAFMLLASLWVVNRQLVDPSYSPFFPNSPATYIRGTFGHYSYFASFLIPCALMLSALALHGRYPIFIRGIYMMIALASLVAVVLTESRGGIIGAGMGLFALALGSILLGKRDEKRWFIPLAIITPVLCIGAVIFFLKVLEGVEVSRNTGSDLTGMMDNTVRFYFLGIAMTCMLLHPWLGGGSRSFSWESFQAWDVAAYGVGGRKPEHVHNELVQTFTDYGVIGGFLLIVFLSSVVVYGLVRLLPKENRSAMKLSDAWVVGGFAGLIGLLAQSCFEGIFRLPSGAILLGLCLAAASAVWKVRDASAKKFSLHKSILVSVAALCVWPLLSWGWKGTQASLLLWSVYFSKIEMTAESKLNLLSEGIEIWSSHLFLQQRGVMYRDLATEPGLLEEEREKFNQFALKDFERASKIHPYDPVNYSNQAGTLVILNDLVTADQRYQQAIEAQGGMEAGFGAYRRYAEFTLRQGAKQLYGGDTKSAVITLQKAESLFEKALQMSAWYVLGTDGQALHAAIGSTLGLALEAEGDQKAALAYFDTISSLPYGRSSHYLAGRLLGRRALAVWRERKPEDALRLFIDAEVRVQQGNPLPGDVTPEQREEYLVYLRNSIALLRAAKVLPSDKVEF